MKNNGYRSDYTTSVGMAEHGWTKAMIRELLGEPDKLAPNPHYRSAAPMRLYKVERVLAIQNSYSFKKSLIVKKARKSGAMNAQVRRFARFKRKYGSWRAALPDACEYLFNLNRYAKHSSCSDANRADIYELKGGMVRLLYQQGCCTQCFEHYHHLPELSCFACDGTGEFDLYEGEACRRCGGSGVYKKARTVTFVCFRFEMDGKTYCWHQPEDLVWFDYEVTADSSEWQPAEQYEKTITLARSRFAIAKDVLRWVLAEASALKTIAA
jgi:hypothetical protein